MSSYQLLLTEKAELMQKTNVKKKKAKQNVSTILKDFSRE